MTMISVMVYMATTFRHLNPAENNFIFSVLFFYFFACIRGEGGCSIRSQLWLHGGAA